MARNLFELTRAKNNNFNYLRLLAASLVLFSHCYPLSGNQSNKWFAVRTHAFTTFVGLAVSCFFICGKSIYL